MTNEEIKELLRIFNESGVGEMEVQRGENRLRIRRAGEAACASSFAPASAPSRSRRRRRGSRARGSGSGQGRPHPDSSHVLVKSPIVGTFYDAPSPGAPAFVKGRRRGGTGPGAVHHRVHEADE